MWVTFVNGIRYLGLTRVLAHIPGTMPPDDHQEVLLLLLISLAEIIMPLMCAYVLPREEFNSPPPANAAYDHMTLAGQ